MSVKMARSGPRSPFGLREVTVAVPTSPLYFRKARKARIFMPEVQLNVAIMIGGAGKPSGSVES
jgi:hypothetical protein